MTVRVRCRPRAGAGYHPASDIATGQGKDVNPQHSAADRKDDDLRGVEAELQTFARSIDGKLRRQYATLGLRRLLVHPRYHRERGMRVSMHAPSPWLVLISALMLAVFALTVYKPDLLPKLTSLLSPYSPWWVIVAIAALIFLERKRPEVQQSAEWIARQQDKIVRGIDCMAEQLGESSWCMGTHFTMADICVGCALGYLAFRFPEIDWREKHPNLGRLVDKLMQRPAFADTVPKG